MPRGNDPEARQSAGRLNRAIAEANAGGADLMHLAAPAIGGAVDTTVAESLLVPELMAGKPAELERLTADLLTLLTRCGRGVQQGGQPVRDPAEASRLTRDVVAGVLEARLPLLQQLGILERGGTEPVVQADKKARTRKPERASPVASEPESLRTGTFR
jgi:hypothetical protein